MEQESVLKTILRNEITWLVSIVIGVMSFVYTVVIPISNLQIQIGYIQNTLKTQDKSYQNILMGEQSLDTRVSILESKISK